MAKEKQKRSRIWWIAGSVALMTASFITIPPLVEICSRKVYKTRLNNQDINIEDFGPRIVKK